ncbi:MAG: right-handed parallel beta-helix repeat-containing protein [Porcipelethomonas sp.]
MINKKIAAVFLAGIMLFSMGSFTVNAENNNETTESGDVNSDGEFNSDDIIAMQKYLLNAGDISDWEAGDLFADGQINVFDLCMMKRKLLSETGRNYVDVSTVEELFIAMRNAKPGDVIHAAGGTYDYTTYQGAQKIDTSAEGTENAPIILMAADPENPPLLTGTSCENGYVLHITGDYWIIENIRVTTSQKGIVLDNSSHSVIRNCEIYNTGSEAIAIRDGSSYCTVKDCYIHDSGTVTPGYGEGVYIGSAESVTGFDYKCDYNIVDGCTFKNIAAEHVDVKEYTTGTEICNCTFYGDGMSGANYAGSFIDIAGNNVNVHDNTGYRNGNANIVAAFELHEQVSGWGYHCTFTDNTLYMDQPYGAIDTSRRMYVVDGWYSDFSVKNNKVDYGNGLTAADSWEYYNSDYVTYLE